MTEEFEFTEDDCVYSPGKHGHNVSFSFEVHNKLDFDWRCAVIVKLMGRPNSTNSFDFMLRGLRRKWQVKGRWQLIDLPNDFFIIKFNLEEDMNTALCVGPWILVGQTLSVRKWRRDFDPNESIGISLICFECGCFGHAKDKCPFVHVTTDVDNNENGVNFVSDVNMDNVMLDTQVVQDIQTESNGTAEVLNDVIKEDMGGNESGDQAEHITPVGSKGVSPPIVKLWHTFDDKMKSVASSGKKKSFNNSTSNMENTTSPSKQPYFGSDLSKAFVKEKAALTMHDKLPARALMKDVSNTGSGSGPETASHYQKKSKGVSSSTTKNQSQVSKKLSFGNMEGISFSSGISAVFGYSPFEEGLKA
ncbi:hypothetical protein ACLB2K_012144 [Fragaria x ananassa]